MSGEILDARAEQSTSLACAAATEALLAEPGVVRCAVVPRRDAEGTTRLVAYVVPGRPGLRSTLETRLSSLAPEECPAVVLVSALPSEGGDQAALAAIPVLDDELVHRLEEAIGTAHPGAEVSRQARVRVQPRVHVRDLSPFHDGGRVQGVEDEASATKASSDRPALSEGEPLRLGDDAPTSLFGVLERAAATEPARGTRYVLRDGREIHEPYAALVDRAASIGTFLAAAGLQPGDPVLLQLSDDREFTAAFWGCVRGGLVPVPVTVAAAYTDDHVVVQKLVATWRLLGRPPVLASPSLLAPLRALGVFEGALRLLDVEAALATAATASVQPTRSDALALLMLTSGSTGAPKLVQQTAASLIARATATSQMNGFGRDEVSLNWFPLDHVGGLVMFHFQAVFDRCAQVQVATDYVLAEPIRWIDLLEGHGVTITWAPNFAFSLIADQAALSARKRDLSRLWFVLNGGEAIVARQAHRFLEVLAPHGLRPTAMRPAWGMSETCSGVTFDDAFSTRTALDAAHTSVGRPVPGFAVRIVDEDGRLMREGQIGELEVHGPSVTRGYLDNDEANAASFRPDGWFRTGDLGRLTDGALTVTGRKKDIIILHGANVSCHEVESVIEDLPGVRRTFTAASATRRKGASSDQIVVFFVPERPEDVDATIEAIRRRVAGVFGAPPVAIVPLDAADVPKTAIGKLERGKLRSRLEAGEWDDLLRAIDLRQANANTVPRWFHRPSTSPRPLATATATAADRALGQRRRWLVLSEGTLGAEVVAALRGRGHAVVEVAPGDAFAEHGPDRFTVVVDDPTHLARVLTAAGPVEQVVHTWLVGLATEEPTAEDLGSAERLGPASLVALAKALAPTAPRSTPLCVVTRDLYEAPRRTRLAPAAGMVVGMLHTLGQELGWLRTRLLDLPGEAGPTTDVVLRELVGLEPDPVVIYDGVQRRVPTVVVADPSVDRVQDELPTAGGLVVITGGLGGVGMALAEHLVERGARSLLLLGRRELGDDPVRRERLARLTAIADATYAIVDVCDAAAVEAAIADAERRGPALAAVFHLASGLSPGQAVALDREALHAALRAKVEGTRVLATSLASRGRPLFLFASVNGTFGGSGYGAYASASSFQESYAAALRRRGRPVHTLVWSMWLRTGMTTVHGDPELARARGFHAMTPDQALIGLDAALSCAPGQWFIGLDDTSPSLAPWCEAGIEPLEELTVGVADASGGTVIDALELRDRFGVPTRVRRLVATRRAVGDAELEGRVATKIAAVWSKVLDLDQLDADSNFFDLGGHSLLIAQVQEGVQAAFGVQIPAVELFRHPTLREFSSAVVERLRAPQAGAPTQAAASGGDGVREQRRRAAQRQRELRNQG